MYNYPFQGQVQQQPAQYVQPMQTMYSSHAAAQVQAQAQARAHAQAQAQAQAQRQMMQAAYSQNAQGQPGYDGVAQYAPQTYGHS